MTKSRISIIIPAYNASNYISEAIQSVIKQTFTDWELIIINDGSTDNSEEIIKKYLEDNRIRYYHQKNAGVSFARNNGVKKAIGNYLAFLDADDFWIETNLEKKIKALETNDDLDYVFGDIFFTDENLDVIEISKGLEKNILDSLLKWEGATIPCPSGNLLIKRKCFDDGLKFDENFSTAADQDFVFYLAAKYNGQRIPEPLMKYRILNQSMSRNITLMEKDHIAVYRKAVRNKLFSSFGFQQKCFSNLYLIIAGSWWKDGKNKMRGFYFIIRSIFAYPPNILKLVKKI